MIECRPRLDWRWRRSLKGGGGSGWSGDRGLRKGLDVWLRRGWSGGSIKKFEKTFPPGKNRLYNNVFKKIFGDFV